jgi:hypothetical protein
VTWVGESVAWTGMQSDARMAETTVAMTVAETVYLKVYLLVDVMAVEKVEMKGIC